MIYLKSSVGIEIRGEDLIISGLKSNLSGSVFTSFRKVAGYRTRNPEEVRQEVARLFRAERLNRDSIVLGIPRSEAVVRYLDLPKEVEDNLKQVMMYQVQSFGPSESEKFCHDYAPVKRDDKDKKLRVLLLMVKKSVLDAHLACLRDLGLRPVIVTIGAAALANVFLGTRNGASNKTFVLADAGIDRLDTTILRNGSLIYSRETPKEEGTAWSGLLRREIELAVSRVRLAPDESIEDIVLAGEASETVQRETREEMPDCRLIGSLLRFEMPVENNRHLQEAACSLGLAFTGMVRRPPLRLNLLPADLRIRQAHWAYIPTIILGLALAGLLTGFGAHRLIQQRTLTRQLGQQIETLQPQVDRVTAVRAQAEALERRVAYVEDLLRKRDMNLEILLELTNILPADTFLNIYRNQDCSLTISGSSSSVSDLIPILEKSPLLAKVSQRSAIFRDPQTGKDRFQFEARCER